MFEQLMFLVVSHGSGVKMNSGGWRESGVVFDVTFIYQSQRETD